MTELFALLETNTLFYLIATFVFSLMVGSFLNVVIYRLPVMMENEWKVQAAEFLELPAPEIKPLSLAKPNSTCPKCGHKIKPWENIPIFSYLFLLKGKCSNCANPISVRYPIIEFVTALLSTFVALMLGANWAAFCLIVITWALIALTMIDIDKQLLPDSITLPMLWSGLIANSFGTFTSFESAFWGAIAGYMSLWTVYQLFKITTGKEGMGFGDFKLLGALGAWLGWTHVPLIILLSSVVGAVIGIAMIVSMGKDKNIPIPFGPYLAIAGWIAFIWGNDIIQWWLNYIKV